MCFAAFQVKKYPHYNFVNLDILDTCATTKNFTEIEDCKNYTLVMGSIANMDLVRNYVYFYISLRHDTIFV